mmetsp:Transcript_18950/g.29284  ORF Transcript_18950/g.29284 Transcript_18950/m.29284 type:complete len:211 (+) Transcript_18950:685-1317(+)
MRISVVNSGPLDMKSFLLNSFFSAPSTRLSFSSLDNEDVSLSTAFFFTSESNASSSFNVSSSFVLATLRSTAVADSNERSLDSDVTMDTSSLELKTGTFDSISAMTRFRSCVSFVVSIEVIPCNSATLSDGERDTNSSNVSCSLSKVRYLFLWWHSFVRTPASPKHHSNHATSFGAMSSKLSSFSFSCCTIFLIIGDEEALLTPSDLDFM